MTAEQWAEVVAAESADWQQIVLNGGPPCFHRADTQFCLRAKRWPGHEVGEEPGHPFVSLPDLLRAVAAERRAEWPDLAPEVLFVVQVYANAGPHDRPDVVGASGPLPQTIDGLISRFFEAFWRANGDASEPEPGFYLIESATGSHRSRLISFETHEQRAERLAREDGDG